MTLEKRYDALILESPEAQPMIDTVRGAPVNIVIKRKWCRVVADIAGGRRSKDGRLPNLDVKELSKALLGCYTSTQPRMLNSSVQYRKRRAQHSSPGL
jgi:hypothetical protein